MIFAITSFRNTIMVSKCRLEDDKSMDTRLQTLWKMVFLAVKAGAYFTAVSTHATKNDLQHTIRTGQLQMSTMAK